MLMEVDGHCKHWCCINDAGHEDENLWVLWERWSLYSNAFNGFGVFFRVR